MAPRKRRPKYENRDDQGGTVPLDFQAAPRAAQAIRLRRIGYTYDEIARQCGYANESGARKAVKTANARIIRDEARMVAAMQQDMLDAALQVVLKRITQDDTGSLWAIDRLVPLLKRQAELMGTDAPKPDAALAQQPVRREYAVVKRT